MRTRSPLPIADVEAATGIPRATLRVWEQRYGFPVPERSSAGERVYPADQVARLRTIASLLKAGRRPRHVVAMPAAELQKLARQERNRVASGMGRQPIVDALRAHDADALLGMLQRQCTSLGLRDFVVQLAELNRAVGSAWECGQLQVFEEHAYTEAVQTVLRHAIMNCSQHTAAGSPRVLLASVGSEMHGLGLLMAHAVFALEGCHCTSLGLMVPAREIAAAATAYRSDVVALTYSANQRSRSVSEQVSWLRDQLEPAIALWLGGSSPALPRIKAEGVLAIGDIASVPQAVASWRRERA